MLNKRPKRIWRDQPEKPQQNQKIQKTENQKDYNIKNHEEASKIKVVLIGDGGSGKTSLLISYSTDNFNQEYTPTVFDLHEMRIKKNNQIYNLQIWDTAGQQQYKKLRALSYTKADIFLICFSLIDVKQFKNATKKWLIEIKQNNPKAQILFIGTKSDLINEVDKKDMMNTECQVLDKQSIQKKIQLLGFGMLACSAITQAGLTGVFDKAIDMVMKKKKESSSIRKKQNNEECKII